MSDMAAILRARTEELDLVTHQRDAIRGEISRLRTENTRLRNSNQVDRDLLAELVEAFRRREARRDVQLATLRAGLREVEAADRIQELEATCRLHRSEAERLRKGLEQIADSIIPDPLYQFITDLLCAEQ